MPTLPLEAFRPLLELLVRVRPHVSHPVVAHVGC
jgi:hypothetical protein